MIFWTILVFSDCSRVIDVKFFVLKYFCKLKHENQIFDVVFVLVFRFREIFFFSTIYICSNWVTKPKKRRRRNLKPRSKPILFVLLHLCLFLSVFPSFSLFVCSYFCKNLSSYLCLSFYLLICFFACLSSSDSFSF